MLLLSNSELLFIHVCSNYCNMSSSNCIIYVLLLHLGTALAFGTESFSMGMECLLLCSNVIPFIWFFYLSSDTLNLPTGILYISLQILHVSAATLYLSFQILYIPAGTLHLSLQALYLQAGYYFPHSTKFTCMMIHCHFEIIHPS